MNKKRAISVLLISIMIITWTFQVLADADELDKAKQDKKNIDSQINQINQQKKNELSAKNKLEQEKKDVIGTEKKESQEYDELIKEIAELEKTLKEVEKALEEAEQNYEKQCNSFKARLRAIYKNSNETILDMLFESKSITAFLEKLEFISLLSKKDKNDMDELELAKKEVECKRQLIAEQKVELQKVIEEKKQRLDSLKASRTNLDQKIQSSKSRLATLEKQEKELLAKSEEMGNLIITLSSKSKYVEGNMVWPLPSSSLITSEYGNRKHPILKTYSMHTGVDIGGKSGANILAANKGTVIISGWQNAYGYTVVVDHGGGITTLYAHCSKILVKKGQEVKAGQIIAKVGSTGWSTGPHLHFEVRVNGATKNPLNYVKP
ncbi:MAG TPA: peptidoglycan DD-metalloendopeptidase family protein [Clostridiales bacterium]|nr:peptidoglycan DD-metalloendopeptidase family protein [Clostridiales bacterium]